MTKPGEEELEEDSDYQDPHVAHFAEPEKNGLSQRLNAIAANIWTTDKLTTASGGRCIRQTPGQVQRAPLRRKIKSVDDIQLKPRLVSNAEKVLGQFSDVEQVIAPSIFENQDILFAARTPKNADRLRHMTCLHALNHLFKTRDRIIKNNAKVSQAQEGDETEYRDQGFVRPKVLFLLETKQACVRAMEAMTQLCDFEQQENKKRFLDSYSGPGDKFSDDRPEDFRELFEGNDENEFRIGLKFTRKTMKLYSKFYNSDIILASALGLRRAIETGDPKKKDYDFLSSIEIVVMEQADATLMQNWEHAEYVFEHLNLQPTEAHGCDFSRVRTWYLDGHAANVRQTIVLSAFLTPKINTLYNKHMRNVAGRIKYTPDYTCGVIENLTQTCSIKQTFSRFESPSHLADPDARFKYFNTTVLPQITRLPKPAPGSVGGLGVLLFIPSYLDFVRIRNFLVDSDLSYGAISEYTDATDVRKARSHFMNGRHSLLLYTGRAHHFHRYNIRGVKRVVFYGVPENVKFYEEIVGFVARSVERGEVGQVEASVRCCFSKWERLELERVVGTKRVGRLINDRGDMFDFV
ncbi:U3 small nucleolar RNA-associated protein 25 [Pleomassaria siparia CBS 279.74]|uniref:U3 small nucleolar RNA-associated protein 25 n=1 Tax=Pleomassaria siparia CBS 279.74 TaxID=1314801 RepID=A0A6G1K962_9PLEO|nr:U3 small nucleolar RNA-associated protein 25 [Pleomassaria siparia CBS 279.74]